MTRFLKIFTILLGSTALASAYTNILENGTNILVSTGWTTTDITVGGNSASNELDISTGGRVTNQNTTVGGSANGNYNVVQVSGDAQWTMTGDLVVGGSNNDVEISGGKVMNADGYIGSGSSSVANSILVSGATSVWHNTGGDLYLGAYWKDGTNLVSTSGGKNVLNVKDGAQVFVGEATNSTLGMLVASTNGATFTVWNGSAFIDDTLTLGLSSNVTGEATIKSGGYLSVGDLILDANTNSVLDLQAGGTFDIRTNFNQVAFEANGFNWGSNSTLSVGGIFTSTTNTLSKGQDLILDGPNATWDNLTNQNLYVGYDGSSTLGLKNGATLSTLDAFIGASSNSGSHAVVLESGSFWLADGDLSIGETSDDNYLEILGGSTNTLNGSAYIGGATTSGNKVTVDGSNSFWDVGGDLFVGNASSNSTGNVFALKNQANAEVGSSITVYGGNRIEMSGGTNTVGGDFVVHSNALVSGSGTVIFSDANAALQLMNGNGNLSSSIIFEGAVNNTVDVGGGIFFVAGSNSNQYRNFQTLDMTGTTLFGYGSNDAFSVVNMTGGIIAPSAELSRDRAGMLVINGGFTSSNTVYYAQVLGNSGADLLHFTGTAVNLTGMVAQVSISQATNFTTTILIADGGLTNNFASTSIVNNLLLFDAELQRDGNEVNVVLTDGTEKFSSSLDYAGTESVRAGFGGMKNAVFTRTKQLRRNLVSTAHSMPHEAFLMTSTNAPAGAQGPGRDNTIFDMHIWMQFFSGQGTYDAQGNSYGYDLNNGGTTIGADRLIGEDLTVGFNYTYARGDANTSNQDHLDTETYWFGAYGEWVSKSGLYVDALAAVGRSDFDSIRVEKDYYGTASYRGSEVGGYVDVGQYYYYKNLSLSPYAGLHILTMKTDEHTESEQNGGSQIKVHEFSRNIVESAVGMKGRYRFDTGIGRFQTTGFAEWTHDFVHEDIYSTLSAVGFAGQYLPPVNMAAIKPDADVLNAGLGFSWICTDYMEIGVGYNGRFSESYEEHAGSLMLDIMF